MKFQKTCELMTFLQCMLLEFRSKSNFLSELNDDFLYF